MTVPPCAWGRGLPMVGRPEPVGRRCAEQGTKIRRRSAPRCHGLNAIQTPRLCRRTLGHERGRADLVHGFLVGCDEHGRSRASTAYRSTRSGGRATIRFQEASRCAPRHCFPFGPAGPRLPSSASSGSAGARSTWNSSIQRARSTQATSTPHAYAARRDARRAPHTAP